MKPSLLSKLFIGVFFILAIEIALSIGVPSAVSGRKIKPLKIERHSKGSLKKPTEMSKEKAEQWKKEREEVKKLLAKHNEKMKQKLEKEAKMLEKDEKYQQRMKEIKAAQALNPEEKREPTMGIPEINENSTEAAYLYQGDIQLSLEQAKFIFAEDELDDDDDDEQDQHSTASNASSDAVASDGRKRRGAAMNATNFPNSKWPDLLYTFSFDDSVSDQLKEDIYIAIQLWSDKTCMHFYEDPEGSPRAHFTSVAGRGCFSFVGRFLYLDYQEVSIGPKCDMLGIIAHEIGHSLGFYHEHARYDRDDFVDVYTENIKPQLLRQFDKQTNTSNDNYGIKYDLGSVMHYGPKSSSKNGKITMSPRAGAMYLNTIGQIFGPSHSDFMMMNMHYCGLTFNESNPNLSWNKNTCDNATYCSFGGFQNPNSCVHCICPRGITGKQCEFFDLEGYAPIGVPNTCNGTDGYAIAEWTEWSGQIGATTMNETVDYAYCHWRILSSAFVPLPFIIEVLEVGDKCTDGCAMGNTEIRTNAANQGDTGVRLCCDTELSGPNKTLSITVTSGEAMISMYAFKGIQRFRLRFRLLG